MVRGIRSLTVAECRALIDEAPPEELPALLRSLTGDPRKAVREAVAAAKRRLAAVMAEQQRLDSLAVMEDELRSRGFSSVAGIDEVGRGALAGPLTAAAVILPPGFRLEGLDDSKRLTPEQRDMLAPIVKASCVGWSVGHVSPKEIDGHGMTWAVREAMTRALSGIAAAVDHVLVDGLGIGLGVPETAVVGGDGKVAAIAAASIVAKTTRDAIMISHAASHPEYLFHENKGYGTPEHLQAISLHGLTPLHRRSFAPCGGTIPLF